jgi:amino acid adenylation domain-containing protein
MGKDLFAREPVFRRAIEEIDGLVERLSGFSVCNAIIGRGPASQLASIDVIQPTIFAVQVALASLLRSWGVVPAAVVGHSSGEIAAAYCAGGISLADAAAVTCRRSLLMRTIAGRGLMLFVSVPAADAERLAALYPGVSLAATNGPSASVLSGAADQVQLLHDHLQRDRRDVFARLVKVDVASHSDQVEMIRDDLLHQLAGISPRPRWTAQLYSTVTGASVPQDAALTATHWWNNLRQTVLFYPVVRQLLAAGFRDFLEIGPHPVLAGNIAETALETAGRVVVLTAQERQCDGRAWLLDVVAQLDARGGAAALDPACPSPPHQHDDELAADQLAALPAERRREVVSDRLHRAIASLGQARAVPLDRQATLFALGLDSLKIVLLTRQVAAMFGVAIPLADTVQCTVGAIEQRIVAALAGPQAPGTAGERGPDPLTTWPSADHCARINARSFELTPLQQAYWLGQGAHGARSAAAHLYFEREARGLDLARFGRALDRLIARHAMLRSFVTSDGRWQSLDRVPDRGVVVVDLRGHAPDARDQVIAETREQMKRTSPSSAIAPCLDVRALILGDDRVRVHVASNLLVLDYTSWRILEREWQQIYDDVDRELPALRITYAEYAHVCESLRQTEAFRAASAYWDRRVADLPPAPALPMARDAIAPVWRSRSIRIAAGTWSALKRRARSLGITDALLLCGSYAEVIGHWSQSQHFTLNLLSQNRLAIHPEIEDLVARFSSTILLEVDQRTDATFRGRLLQLQDQFFRDFDHRVISGVEVARRYNQLHHSGGAASFPVVYASVLGTRGSGSVPMSWVGSLVDRCLKTPQVTLDHQVYEEAGELVSSWDYVETAFCPGVPEQLIHAYQALLEALASDDASWDARRPISDERDRRRSAPSVPDRPAVRPASPFLQAGFIEQAKLGPDRVAIITPSLRMSYGELDRRSDALAQRLIELGARPNQLVAIVMERGWEQVVAAIAILKAGAAYLPIDVSVVPPARIQELLELGEVRLAMTQPRLGSCLDGVTVLEVSVDDRVSDAASPAHPRCSPEDLAYVIFTSGSTGVPKGVMIEHAAVVNTIEDINARFGIAETDRVIALASLGFDLSVWDIFGTLAAGGAIAMPGADARLDPERWYQLAAEAGVTVWNSVPKVMELLVDHVATKRRRLPASLRLVMMSGDWIPVGLPDAIRANAGSPGMTLVSLGGATEVSIWSIFYPIEDVDPAWPSIPYGRAMSDQSVVVLDAHMREREPWVQGEIFIGGRGLARGYWRNAALTAQSFVVSAVDGRRLYRTGDLGRYLPDGTIEFLGRSDTQLKIRGYRVELGEIEVRIAQHPAVKQCLVVAHASGAGSRDQQIVAYVVLHDGEQLAQDALIDYLSTRVPFYMVPSFFVFMTDIPLSRNGKVDRKALPSPHVRSESAREIVGPRDDTEARVLTVWRSVLGVSELGVTNGFFEIGGDSIQLIRVTAALEREFGVPFTVESLFSADLASVTVESCANRLRETTQVACDRRRALVSLQTGGQSPAFFAVHPVGGSVLCYARMAALIGADQRFYALQSIPVRPDRPFDPIPELAARYIEELREVQPAGPYLLGGWSLGGTIAVEMARQLHSAGQPVALLALIDSWAPMGSVEHPRDDRVVEWFCRDVGGIARKDIRAVQAELRATGPVTVQRAAALIRGHGIVSGEVTEAALVEMFARYARNVHAGAAFEPLAYPGPAMLIRAAVRPSRDELLHHPALRNPQLDDPSHGWSSYIQGPLALHDAPGNHYGVVGPEGVETTARILAAAIQAARSTPVGAR